MDAADGGAARLVRQLQDADQAAQRFNCRGFLFFSGNRSPLCLSVMANIDRLQQQLNNVQARPGPSGFDVASLRQALVDGGCSLPEQSASTLRTVCVRVCDGYYFPINNSSRRSQTKIEAQTCDSTYAQPGQAFLYSYSASGDVADATSVDGKRYGDQPFAFQYRASFDAGCAAQLKQGIAALAARYLEARQVPNKSPIAGSRPGNPTDTDFLTKALLTTSVGQPAPVQSQLQDASQVRIVGPDYYARIYSSDRPFPPKQSRPISSEAPSQTPAVGKQSAVLQKVTIGGQRLGALE